MHRWFCGKFVLVVASVYGSWDIGLFLCQLVFVAIFYFWLIAFLFSLRSVLLCFHADVFFLGGSTSLHLLLIY